MEYVTIEAEITDGKIIPKKGTQLPERGHALITLLPHPPRRPNWVTIKAAIGILQNQDIDSVSWQRKVRADWDNR